MNWKALRDLECPSCGNALDEADKYDVVRCPYCEFKISQDKLDDMDA